jgi:hypothetical protein
LYEVEKWIAEGKSLHVPPKCKACTTQDMGGVTTFRSARKKAWNRARKIFPVFFFVCCFFVLSSDFPPACCFPGGQLAPNETLSGKLAVELNSEQSVWYKAFAGE